MCEKKSEVDIEVSGKTEHLKFSLGYGVRKGARNGKEGVAPEPAGFRHVIIHS